MKLNWIDVLLILFGLFIVYKLSKAIFGGSWQTESIVIALLIFNLGLTYRMALKIDSHISWHRIKRDIVR